MNYWYNEAIFYQLYPLGQFGCKATNEYNLCENNFSKIYDWVAHIKQLNCNAVYFGPIFESKTHGYDTTDYKKIDSRLGTNEDFKNIVEHLHSEGIKVVVDGVFNHVGRDFFAFKDINNYKDWFCGIDFSKRSPYNDNFCYDSWRGNFELVKLNLQNQAVKNYLLECVQYWMEYFNIDGIRLDCADVLDFEFMKELRQFCIAKSSDFWLMGEVIHGDYSEWANENTLHSVTNYECYKGIYSSHNDKNLYEIAYSLNRQFNTASGMYKNLALYNFVDNHDVTRIASCINSEVDLYTAYMLLFTIPGVPSIYYGSEWGIKAEKQNRDDWNLRPSLTVNSEIYNRDIENEIKRFSSIRKNSEALKCGTYEQLTLSNELFSFKRKSAKETVIVIINISDKKTLVKLPTGNTYCDMLKNGEIVQETADVFPHWGRILKLC